MGGSGLLLDGPGDTSTEVTQHYRKPQRPGQPMCPWAMVAGAHSLAAEGLRVSLGFPDAHTLLMRDDFSPRRFSSPISKPARSPHPWSHKPSKSSPLSTLFSSLSQNESCLLSWDRVLCFILFLFPPIAGQVITVLLFYQSVLILIF